MFQSLPYDESNFDKIFKLDYVLNTEGNCEAGYLFETDLK